jgi:hypothetical protein
LSRVVCLHAQAYRAEKVLDRNTHRRVVVNDKDDRLLRYRIRVRWSTIRRHVNLSRNDRTSPVSFSVVAVSHLTPEGICISPKRVYPHSPNVSIPTSVTSTSKLVVATQTKGLVPLAVRFARLLYFSETILSQQSDDVIDILSNEMSVQTVIQPTTP